MEVSITLTVTSFRKTIEKLCSTSRFSQEKKLQQSTEILLIVATFAHYTQNTKRYRVNGSSGILIYRLQEHDKFRVRHLLTLLKSKEATRDSPNVGKI